MVWHIHATDITLAHMYMCSFLVWKTRCFSFREFYFECDLVGVRHTWYLSGQSFITRLQLVWKDLVRRNLNNCVRKRTVYQCVSEDMECRWVTNRTERFETCSCNPRTRFPMLSDQILTTAWAAKGATRTTPVRTERFYKAENANIEEQSGGERPPLLSGCTQLKPIRGST